MRLFWLTEEKNIFVLVISGVTVVELDPGYMEKKLSVATGARAYFSQLSQAFIWSRVIRSKRAKRFLIFSTALKLFTSWALLIQSRR